VTDARDADDDLLAALKALRTGIARSKGQPAYVIFPDRSLIEMALQRPQTIDDLSAVHGVGAAKLERYGAAFLAVIRDHPHA
jgi:ATP-dependent DNA helicase RecQ